MKNNKPAEPVKQKLLFRFRTWSKSDNHFTARELTEEYHQSIQLSTNKTDKNNQTIFAGDIIKLHNKGEHCRPEYWNPIYEVTWDGFEFGLKHLGGGKSIDSIMFHLRYRSTSEFEIIGNVFESTIILPKK